MLLNGFFRFTMKRHGKKPINIERLRAMSKNPPRSALAIPPGYRVDNMAAEQGLTHVWPVFVTLLPEARDAFATVAAFAREIGARQAA